MMVQSASITAFIVNIIICFGLPLGCILYLIISKQRAFIPVLVGAGVFIVFQLILRIPLINYALAPMDWFSKMMENSWLYGIFLGLTAGIFEETGRYLGYRTLLKKRGRWIDGFAFGVGHGGIEAMVLGGLTNISNLALALSINNGSFQQIADLLPEETAQQIITQLTSAQPFDIFLGGIERIFAFAIQIALSLLVLYAVRQRKPIYFILAILAHMLIDAPLVILPSVFGTSVYALEIILAVLAGLSVLFIILSRKLFPQHIPEEIPKNIE